MDYRKQGISYGYVAVPKGGLNVNGVDFPAGPRPAGKSGWFKQLLMAGCEEISQAEYEASLTESQDLSGKETDGAEPEHAGRAQDATRRKGRQR